MKKSNTDKNKVILQSNTMRKIRSIRLTDKQNEKWDKKIHPELFRYILDNNIGMKDIEFIKDLLGGI